VIGDRALGSGEFSQGGCHPQHGVLTQMIVMADLCMHLMISTFWRALCQMMVSSMTMHMHVKSILTWLQLTSCLKVTEER